MPKLGVNIDHIATLRQARGENYPDPIAAARICESAGADSIVCHLREDRRHIQDADVAALRKIIRGRVNLELSLAKSILDIACRIKPDEATIVPERRQEITTEGGLNVVRYFIRTRRAIQQLKRAGIEVSLFIDPEHEQILASHKSGVSIIELHTGKYATAKSKLIRQRELAKLKIATSYAQSLGLSVAAGHGLTYTNTLAIARIPGIKELNIGHSIISQSVFVGLKKAVQDMRTLAKGKAL